MNLTIAIFVHLLSINSIDTVTLYEIAVFIPSPKSRTFKNVKIKMATKIIYFNGKKYHLSNYKYLFKNLILQNEKLQ